jgi:hypothetical protein
MLVLYDVWRSVTASAKKSKSYVDYESSQKLLFQKFKVLEQVFLSFITATAALRLSHAGAQQYALPGREGRLGPRSTRSVGDRARD